MWSHGTPGTGREPALWPLTLGVTESFLNDELQSSPKSAVPWHLPHPRPHQDHAFCRCPLEKLFPLCDWTVPHPTSLFRESTVFFLSDHGPCSPSSASMTLINLCSSTLSSRFQVFMRLKVFFKHIEVFLGFRSYSAESWKNSYFSFFSLNNLFLKPDNSISLPCPHLHQMSQIQPSRRQAFNC